MRPWDWTSTLVNTGLPGESSHAEAPTLLNALLEPLDTLRKLEVDGDFSSRLALMEELKAMPAGAVWDQFCQQKGVPVGIAFMDVIKDYEKQELSKR